MLRKQWGRIGTVSYTHLDVYKRQFQGLRFSFNGSSYVIDTSDSRDDPDFIADTHFAAVSYTHLDVYKRQAGSSGGDFLNGNKWALECGKHGSCR